MEPENLLLDRYILAQARTADPVVGFVPTASGDQDNYVRRFYDAFTTLQCRPRHLSLFRVPTDDLAALVMELDVIYVGGGKRRSQLLVRASRKRFMGVGSVESRRPGCGGELFWFSPW